MLTFAAGDTIAAGASAASKVTSTIFGMELTAAGVEVYKVLDQRQLAASPEIVYTVPASTTAFVKTISAVNGDASARTAQYFRGGTAAANAITQPVTIPAGGMAIYEDGGGWDVYDSAGQLQTVSYTVTGGVPVGGIIMWSGTIATIPATWALCDGTQNAPGPDLRDKFVVGATSDDAGIAKTNIAGALSQSGGATGHSHSGHAALSHSGFAITDHTGLTHGLSIANHPDLTHAAIASHTAIPLPGLTHADVSLPGYTHPVLTIEGATHAVQSIASRSDLTAPGASHALLTIEGMTHAVQSIASRDDLSAAGLTHPVLTLQGITHADLSVASRSVDVAAIAGKASFASGTNRSGMTSVPTNTGSIAASTYTLVSHPTVTASAPASHPTRAVSHPAWSISPASHPTFTASAPASHPTGAVSHPAWSISPASHPTFTASAPASHAAATLTQASHPTMTAAGLTHEAAAAHTGTDYGVHTVTAPAAHGAAGTVTHSFSESSAHAVSAHDTVSILPSYFALAFIQRIS